MLELNALVLGLPETAVPQPPPQAVAEPVEDSAAAEAEAAAAGTPPASIVHETRSMLNHILDGVLEARVGGQGGERAPTAGSDAGGHGGSADFAQYAAQYGNLEFPPADSYNLQRKRRGGPHGPPDDQAPGGRATDTCASGQRQRDGQAW